MPKSTSWSNSILALLLNATAIANIADNAASSPITNVYTSLHEASLNAAATQTTSETDYTDYARVAVARTTSGWTVPSGGSSQNVAAIDFPSCGASGATIVATALGKSVSGANPVFYYGDLNAPITVSNAIQPRFAAGAYVVSEA